METDYANVCGIVHSRLGLSTGKCSSLEPVVQRTYTAAIPTEGGLILARRRSTSPSPTHEYPRPQLVRRDWTNLNGEWDFAIDADAVWQTPSQVKWKRTIRVPFAPETPASGVHDTGFYQQIWYRRTFTPPRLRRNDRLILHFGAVDYHARVWVNGRLAAEHEGGYTPFSADITHLLGTTKSPTIEVCAADDPHDLAKPRGKQDWHLQAHGIWYNRTTGIWQTVWMEVVPALRIDAIGWRPNLDRGAMGLCVELSGGRVDGHQLRVRLKGPAGVNVDDTYRLQENVLEREIQLVQGTGDAGLVEMLWSPDHPQLIDAELELLDKSGKVCDRVTSYCAMRSVAVEGTHFLLNRRPLYLRMALDQGYWEETGMTAPGDEAIRRDVELAKDLGFNGVRKHQKIEDPRFLYWADKLGLLVWEELPSPMRFDSTMIRRATRDWTEAIRRDASHPCIVCWVPFNESWGVFDLPQSQAQRDLVRGMYHLTRSLDPTRPCIGNDGWEAVAGDILGIHDYERDPRRLEDRYDRDDDDFERMLQRDCPGGRMIMVDGYPRRGEPVMLTEFGGIGFSRKPGTWGYYRVSTEQELAERYTQLLESVRKIPTLSGFCYTQLTDTYQEANGLLYMDRTPKFPIEQIRKATKG